MNSTYEWYQKLIKPTWAPPSYLFGPVWTLLYILIAITFGTVFLKIWRKELPAIIGLPFLLNIFFNLIFTPIQFGLKNNLYAAVDITLVLITLLWAMYAIYPHARWIALLQLPYVLWVTFATVLQLNITLLNK